MYRRIRAENLISDHDGFQHIISVSKLHLATANEENAWATQLRYGNAILIEARQQSIAEPLGCEKSSRWFCEEVKFLGYEFRARDRAAAEKLDPKAVKETRSRIVKLKVRRKNKVDLKDAENSGEK